MEIETNKFKRFIIRYWYNDWVRMLVLLNPFFYLGGGYVLFILGVPEEYIGNISIGSWFIGMAALMLFNDYNTLNRIGLDCYRNPLK